MKISVKRNVILLIVIYLLSACSNSSWRTASRESANFAPSPDEHTEAIIQVYAADAYSWRGWFAVHTWIAIKPKNATDYTVYEVVGWRVRRGLPALKSYQTNTPDRYWYGAKPDLLLSISGEKASTLIPEITEAVSRYPWADEYTVFPGPNSNTFPQWVANEIPELGLKLPFRAIGSGYAN